MEIKIDEQFVRKAYIEACTEWRGKILKEAPDLYKGWFKSMVGNIYVFCGEKNTMVEKITTSWLVSPQEMVKNAVREIKEHPGGWEKVDLYSPDWHDMIKSIVRQYGMGNESSLNNLMFYRDKITMTNPDRLTLQVPVLLFDNGEWLLEKDYTVDGTDLRGIAIYKVIEKNEASSSCEDERYFVGWITCEQDALDQYNTFEKIKKAFEDGFAFFNEEDAEEAARKLNWLPGKLHWVRDNDRQEWAPRIAADEYGRFEGLTKGIYVSWKQWKRANCSPDKPSE